MSKRANSTATKIRTYLQENPTATPKKVAEVFNITAQYVSVVKHGMKKAGEKTVALKSEAPARPVPKKWKTLHISTSNNSVEKAMELAYQAGKGRIRNPQIEMIEPESDPVNHPAHYKVGGIETIDFIEAKRLNYNMGNAVKYITRADHKGSRKQDLEKAIWYLKRELDHSV
jgi:hypothetical protein